MLATAECVSNKMALTTEEKAQGRKNRFAQKQQVTRTLYLLLESEGNTAVKMSLRAVKAFIKNHKLIPADDSTPEEKKFAGSRIERCARQLLHEMAYFIECQEMSERELDTELSEFRYDDGIYLILKKTGGKWHILDIHIVCDGTAATVGYILHTTWKEIWRGASRLLREVITGWWPVFEQRQV